MPPGLHAREPERNMSIFDGFWSLNVKKYLKMTKTRGWQRLRHTLPATLASKNSHFIVFYLFYCFSMLIYRFIYFFTFFDCFLLFFVVFLICLLFFLLFFIEELLETNKNNKKPTITNKNQHCQQQSKIINNNQI